MKIRLSTVVYVVVSETRISENFSIYPEVFDDFYEAEKYARDYIHHLREGLIAKNYAPEKCIIEDEGLVKYLNIYDGDEYARVEIFRKEITVRSEVEDSSLLIDNDSSSYRENFI